MRMTLAALMLLAAAWPAAAQGQASADVVKELAPTGKLRAAINFGNAVLAQKGPDGMPKGVTSDLARELARRLGVPVELVVFEAAGKVVEAAKTGAWDVGFVAADPARAGDIEFTAAYVIIEGAYMLRKDSPVMSPADVDKPGIRVAVGRGSAYDPFLTRTLKQATVVRAETGGGHAMIEMFVRDKLDVCAGVRQQLEAYAKDHPEVRILPEAFQQIQQAMATPKKPGDAGKAGHAYVAAFVEEMKASGFVAEALKRSNQVAKIAPPAR